MPICKKCNQSFPNRIWIDGKQKVLCTRKYCLDCSPYGVHNRVQLHKHERKCNIVCVSCNKEYWYDRSNRKGSTRQLCGSCTTKNRVYEMKARIIEYLGGKCILCEYNKCPAALHAHHREGEDKLFNLSGNHCRSWENLKGELDKCDLICANCHAEIHYKGKNV